jgi:3D (Asp-Asp-Asp) domain-containing protein
LRTTIVFILTLVLAIGGTTLFYEDKLKSELESSHKTISSLEENQKLKLNEIAKLEGVVKSQNEKLKVFEDLTREYENQNGKLKDRVEFLDGELKKYDNLRQLDVVATAYTAFCNTGCTGVTATGTNVANTVYKDGHRVVAVDPRVIPLGSLIHVEAEDRSFIGIADDTGGAIKGNKVDVLVKNKPRAYAFGKQDVKITVLREGRG